jgi:Uma2 family endonuclease
MQGYFETHPIGKAVLGLGVIFDQFNGVVPDLLFVSHERFKRILAGSRLSGAPEIVIEILSPGAANEERDRRVKRQLYSTAGVSEYWILDPATRTIEIHRKRKEGGLRRAVILQPEDELTSLLLPEFRVPVVRLFE